VQLLMQQAMAAQRAGRAEEAERLLGEAVKAEPERYDILHFAGMAAVQRKDVAAAVDLFGRAARAAPQVAALQVNLGNALVEAGRFAEAIEVLDRLVQAEPALAEAWNSRGAALRGAGELGAALDSYARAAKLQPDNASALCNLGGLLANLGQPQEGLEAYGRAIAAAPNLAEAWNGRSRVLLLLQLPAEALASAEQALALRPRMAEAHAHRGFALETLGRVDEAAAAYAQALALDGDLPRKLLQRGLYLGAIDRNLEASIYYQSALALDPSLAQAHLRLGQARIGREPEAALESLKRALQLDPGNEEASAMLVAASMPCCEWSGLEDARRRIKAAVDEGRPANPPFIFLTLSSSPADALRCVELWVERHFPPAATPLAPEPYAHERLRVGYVSADFQTHATAWLTAAFFEHHDRSRFETFAFSTNAPKESDMRARLRAAFDHFVDCADLDDARIAGLIRERQIDVLIDLKGFTAEARTGIFAHRPAPVQAQWLGFPGSMGAPYIDYIIADAVVIPPGDERFYSEAVVRLPGSYQPNDPSRAAAAAPSRREAGLPDEGFVFCCFNAAYKILPEMFDIWMRLLGRVEGSVLWLLADNRLAQENLRREAQARGIDPDRLVFAPRADQEAHLGRLALADLVLDTLPYGAHTTASDALWAGVPVLTCYGQTFPGRVGASLLTAVGLPELIAPDLAAYEALALSLAGDPARLARLRAHLAGKGRASPLFDVERFTRQMESALATMSRRRAENMEAQGFDVEATGP
jgi:predicted O-linked N-acetylglucosamine transferase (SPINDLY family)